MTASEVNRDGAGLRYVSWEENGDLLYENSFALDEEYRALFEDLSKDPKVVRINLVIGGTLIAQSKWDNNE